jgi:two-component system KDP operon response regulator KdpE
MNNLGANDLQRKRVLIIDDDPDMLELLSIVYSRAKAQVHVASNGNIGLREFYACQPDLVLLDLMMPQKDGWEVCRVIRQLSDVPIIILSSLYQDKDIIRGLDTGANDYLTKPVNFDILLARSRAALRQGRNSDLSPKRNFYSDDDLTINLNTRAVSVQGKPIKLTAKEYMVLVCLVQNADQLVTGQQIMEKVWGWEYRDSVEYVHVYISRLRKKLEVNPTAPKYVLTEHGVGYRFETQISS